MNDRAVLSIGLSSRGRERTFRLPRRRGFPVSLAGLLLLFFAAFPAEVAGATAQPQIQSQPTRQSSARSLALTYEVYAGGLHIFSFDVNLSLRPQGYRIAAAGSTRGITGVFYKWDVSLTAEGHSFQPARYVTVNGGRQAAKTMQLDFIKGGSFTVRRNPPEPVDESDEEGKLPSSLPANIADPLSAGLIASRTLAETGSCEQTIPVFDGKRRYNLLLHDAGVGTVPKSRLSVYHGPAIRCGFTMERISGFKKQRRYASQWDEDKDEPPILWVAKIRENMPPIPVRFTGAVSLGSIVIHLARVEPGPELAGTEP